MSHSLLERRGDAAVSSYIYTVHRKNCCNTILCTAVPIELGSEQYTASICHKINGSNTIAIMSMAAALWRYSIAHIFILNVQNWCNSNSR